MINRSVIKGICVKKFLLGLLLSLGWSLALAQSTGVAVENLPSGGTVQAGDFSICDQGGTTYKCTMNQVLAFIQNSLNVITVSGLPTIGQCAQFVSTNSVAGVACGGSGGGGTFGSITSGANSSAVMTCVSTCSLSPSGGGLITANLFTGLIAIANGGTGATTLGGASIPVATGTITSGNCAYWANASPPALGDSGNGCGSGGSSTAFSALTSSVNTTASMTCGTGCRITTSGSGANEATKVSGYVTATSKTLTINNTMTLSNSAGADGQSFTLPDRTGGFGGLLVSTDANQIITNKQIDAGEIFTGALSPAVGGTGVNNGSSTLTLNHASVFNSTTGNVGTLELLQNPEGVNYVLVIGDSGKQIYHNSTSPHTLGIPSNASVAFPVGTTETFINENGGGNVTLTIATDTLLWSPVGPVTTNCTISALGFVTAVKILVTTWIISGSGMTCT